jgi:hypothetical protein
MKVELHMHTRQYSACAAHAPKKMLSRLRKLGYDAVYLTEHDAVWPDEELQALRERFPRLRVFPGVELSLGPDGTQHLLVLGTNDEEYLRLDEAGAIARARDEGHLTVLAHPFRWQGAADMLDEGLLPDALEQKTCNHDLVRARLSGIAAEKLSLRLVNSSDAHHADALGHYWIETSRPVEEADDIRAIVLEGAYENREA